VDRIFTRIGAADELAAGQSTFMVEMVETANILNHATPRSLLILDEIGRGTSTYDGLAIAWAVVEYLHNHPERRARTLFATHYHELIELAQQLPHVRNFNLAVAEEGHEVIFLHKPMESTWPGWRAFPRPWCTAPRDCWNNWRAGSFAPGQRRQRWRLSNRCSSPRNTR